MSGSTDGRMSGRRRQPLVVRIDRRWLAVAMLGTALGLGASSWLAQTPAGAASPPRTGRDLAAVADRLSVPADYAAAQSADQRRQALARTLRTEGPEATWRTYVAPAVAGEDVALSTTEQPTEGQLEALRDQMKTFYADLHVTVELLPESQRLDLVDKIAEAEVGIDDLTLEQLNETHAALRPYPGFWSIPAYARSVLEQLEHGATPDGAAAPAALPPNLRALPGLPGLMPERVPTVPSQLPQEYNNCKEFGKDPTCDGCPPPVAGGEATIFALQTAAWAAESVCSYFDGDITVFGTQIPNWAKIVCVVAYAALQATADAVQLAHDISQECENDFHAHLLNAYLDETISSRASQQSHNFHRLWELRLEMEDAMLDEANQRVSLFQLPRANGGYLNTQDDLSVRYVVGDTIATLSAAGYDVRNAQTEYNTAEAHLAAGRFKDAFARYRLAYRAAVSVGREP